MREKAREPISCASVTQLFSGGAHLAGQPVTEASALMSVYLTLFDKASCTCSS